MKSVPKELVRKLCRQRRGDKTVKVVAIDQSLSNCACVLFEDGIPKDRCVFHTGDPTTKDFKNRLKRGDTIFGEYFESHVKQVEYITSQVIEKMSEWNPNYVCLEGLAFNAQGMKERQLAGLYHSILTSLHRELGYCIDTQLITVTPTQVKKIAREHLPEADQYTGEYTSRGKPKLNPMKKSDMVKALQTTKHKWILDGYTRKTLVASRKNPTGLEDLPDAYFIGLYFLKNKKQFIK